MPKNWSRPLELAHGREGEECLVIGYSFAVVGNPVHVRFEASATCELDFWRELCAMKPAKTFKRIGWVASINQQGAVVQSRDSHPTL